MKVGGQLFNPPASEYRVNALRRSLPKNTPSDYFEFLQASDGGEIWFDDAPPEGFDSLGFHSISEMLQYRSAHVELLPHLLVIGGDQGSQFLAYDMEATQPWPIVMFLPGWGAEPVAASMTALRRLYFKQIGEQIEMETEQSRPANPSSPSD